MKNNKFFLFKIVTTFLFSCAASCDSTNNGRVPQFQVQLTPKETASMLHSTIFENIVTSPDNKYLVVFISIPNAIIDELQKKSADIIKNKQATIEIKDKKSTTETKNGEQNNNFLTEVNQCINNFLNTVSGEKDVVLVSMKRDYYTLKSDNELANLSKEGNMKQLRFIQIDKNNNIKTDIIKTF